MKNILLISGLDMQKSAAVPKQSNGVASSYVFNPFTFGNLGFNSTNMYQDNFMNTLKMFEMFMENGLMMPNIPMMDFNTAMNPTFNYDFYNESHIKKDSTNPYNKNKANLAALKNVYNPELSSKLADIAFETTKTLHFDEPMCYHGVKKALRTAGIDDGKLEGRHAYLAEEHLSNHKNFKEVYVSREDLMKLPAGCVIVWQPSEGHKSGHIAVTLGDGKEASDKVRNLIIRNTGYSVFVPTGINKVS